MGKLENVIFEFHFFTRLNFYCFNTKIKKDLNSLEVIIIFL